MKSPARAGFLYLAGIEMPMIISDAIEHAGAANTAIAPALWAKGFAEAEFYLKEGNPYAVFPGWDHAEYWGTGGVREVHPFGPIQGQKISEGEFRAMVREFHGLT